MINKMLLTLLPAIATISRMTQSKRIIEKFGTQSKLARALIGDDLDRLPSMRVAIHGWLDRGFVPANRQQDVLDAARRLGIDLTPADFFDLPPCPAEAPDAPHLQGE